MDIIVRTGTSEIIASGNVIVPNGDYVEFLIKNLRFRLLFQEDPDVSRSYVKAVVINPESSIDSYMELLAFNFTNSIFNTLNSPIRVAYIDGRQLSLRLSVSSVCKRSDENNPEKKIEDKLVVYSWCLDFPEKQSGDNR